MKKQWEQVYDAMESNGGFATLNQLYDLIDFKSWGTKTPHATVRQIVQLHKEFFRIKPGLWGLTLKEKDIRKTLGINKDNTFKNKETRHSYYQGAIATIGNMRKIETYIPNQDKNKMYLNKPLKEISSMDYIYNFTYKEILDKAKTVDVIWFNIRKMPMAFYEIENTTDITHSLNKFYELQDFNSKFVIVAPKERKREYIKGITNSIYSEIKNRIYFKSYDEIDKQLECEKNIVKYI